MPELLEVLSEEELKAKAPVSAIDLTPYKSILNGVIEKGGAGGIIGIKEDESKRVEKRRLSVAAKELGYNLTWRKAEDNKLRFVLNKEGEPVPGGRKRK
jgi:hypothetical protein